MKVVELFAGVGGFRLAAQKSKGDFEFVFANQWEPGRTNQFAFKCYEKHFGTSDTHVNDDINKVKYQIPKNFDLLVGGFPCQDYSVAATKSKGIEGKKGVLWWEIDWILKNRSPKYVLLENVDRLLKSPAKQRGRDFAIMLRCFYDNGYNVEWMVNNGADYGHTQRRKRVFIFATKSNKNNKDFFKNTFDFKIKDNSKIIEINIKEYEDTLDITKNYNKGKFLEYGTMVDGNVTMYDIVSTYSKKQKVLGNVLDQKIDTKYYLSKEQMEKFKYLKGSKRILRQLSNGHEYYYTEGKMSLYDDINKPSRTMLTSEGTINRSSHIIKEGNKYRFITPEEAEALNDFPKGWTNDMVDRNRYFCMGNALIVNLVKEMFVSIDNLYNKKK